MKVKDLAILFFTFSYSVLALGKRLPNSNDDDDVDDDWNDKLFGNNKVVTLAVIIILGIILITKIVFQIASFCMRKYR